MGHVLGDGSHVRATPAVGHLRNRQTMEGDMLRCICGKRPRIILIRGVIFESYKQVACRCGMRGEACNTHNDTARRVSADVIAQKTWDHKIRTIGRIRREARRAAAERARSQRESSSRGHLGGVSCAVGV